MAESVGSNSMDEFEESVRKTLREEGLDDEHWINEMKEKLNIKNIRLIRRVKLPRFEGFLDSIEDEVERSALRAVIDKKTGVFKREEEVEKKRKEKEENEKEKRKKEKEDKEGNEKKKVNEQTKKAEDARKDVQRTTQEVREKAKSGLKEYNKKEPEGFGNPSNLMIKGQNETSELTPRGGTVFNDRENWTASETVRRVQGGALTKGIYLSKDSEELLKDREKVLRISDNLVFRGPISNVESLTAKFTTQQATQTFENNIDKALSTESGSRGYSGGGSEGLWYFGVSTEASNSRSESKEHEKKKSQTHEKSFMSVVTTELTPVASVDMEPKYLHLTEKAVDELKTIEEAIKPLNYKSKGHFQQFFERFGSHVNHGTIEFGGILMSEATSKGFKEENREKVSDVLSKASETSISLGFSIGGLGAKAGGIVGSEKVFGETKGKYYDKEVYDTKVRILKMGGPPEVDDKDAWRNGLLGCSSLFRIVKRNLPLKPIWEFLSQHDYQDPTLLAHAMEEEFGYLVENKATYRYLDALRRDVKIWLHTYQKMDEESMVDCMEDLARIQHKYDSDVSTTDWRKEVLYSQEVQSKILEATQGKHGPYLMESSKIHDLLRRILHPMDGISRSSFPNIESIKQAISGLCRDPDILIPHLEISRISDLPNVLRESTADYYSNIKGLSHSLEQFLLRWKTENKVTEEFLVCLCVMNCSGFNLEKFIFERPLDKITIEEISDTLDQHLLKFQLLENRNQKQAYILKLAFDSPQPGSSLQYMMDRMEVEVKLKQTWKLLNATDNVRNCVEFRDELKDHLDGGKTKMKLDTLVQSLKIQFQSILNKPLEHRDESLPQDGSHASADRIMEQLEQLGMTKYFPQKLKYEDVIMLTSDVFKNFYHTPANLKELPWYFIKHIIGLDSTTRDNSVIIHQADKIPDEQKSITELTGDNLDVDFSNMEFNDDSEEDEISETDEGNQSSFEMALEELHPLDLIYIIFLCADDFLRQELADKMLKNQYAIPLIMPSPQANTDSKSTILHWCLKGISRTFTLKDNVLHKTLVDMETPLVTCMNIGRETSWKSKLMNAFLSPQQETFWHQGLVGGNYQQKISDGMVEVAWYLPGGHGDDIFNKAVAFTNLRGNASNHPTICDRLIEHSSATYIFTTKLDKEVFDFLKTRGKNMKKLTLVVLQKSGQRTSIERTFEKKFGRSLRMTNDQLITGFEDDSNFNIIMRSLKESLNSVVEEENKRHVSLSRLVTEIKADSMDVDDLRSHQGEVAAVNTLKDIDALNRGKLGNAKQKILPCQSDLGFREEMAKYDKEICRQKKKTKDQNLRDYAQDVEENKWKLRLEQLQKPISETFKYFLKCVLNLNSIDRKYFLHSLSLGLNERSVEILQPLYKRYEQSRLEVEEMSNKLKDVKKKEPENENINGLASELEVKNANLKKLDEQLTDASFGLEHFFREMALMYENIAELKKRTKTEELGGILDALSGVVAEIFLEGTAIEILDGDAMSVPVLWLNALINKIENSGRDRVFKLAILGAQSCGKSTILNTAFGLHFPVSSGRCTRGAYMQLVKVEEEFRKTLNCEYILVIDSEGLMSRSMTNRSEYDNELATFVLGQSDLTLVVIKGEGKEMEDVLPIAIHVFLRMKKVGELQGCHFVHQNMGSQDAKIKNVKEINDFVGTLDEKTRAAAIDTEQNDKYTDFTDVLLYDKTKDNTFVPGLWDGSEPMAKTNINYSSTMQRLKAQIVHRLADITKGKRLSTLRESSRRLNEIWDAIKNENFVFSFKNVLAIEAHQQLSNVFNDKQWDIKTKIRTNIQEETIAIEKKVQEHQGQNTVNRIIDELIKEATRDANKNIATSAAELRKDIKHYFVCTGEGCSMEAPCSKGVRNRHLIADNEKEFMDDIKELETTLKEEVKASLNTLQTTLKANIHIDKLSKDMDTRLKKKVKEVVSKEKTKDMTEAEVNQIFYRLWNEETEDIMKDMEPEVIDIKTTIENLMLERLGTNNHLYRERKSERKAYGAFIVQEDHMKMKGCSLTIQDIMNRLHEETKRIIGLTANHYRIAETRKAFQNVDVSKLIEDVLRMIEEIKDDRFETTSQYKVDLLIHIKKNAVDSFPMQNRKTIGQKIDQTVCNLLTPNEYSTYEQRKGFLVHSNHIKTGLWNTITGDKNAKSCLKEKSTEIVTSTERHYSSPSEGKKFKESDADVLFKEIQCRILEIKEATSEYQVDLMMYIENLAVKGFTELHKMYCDTKSPRALLEKKQKGYHGAFMNLMREGDTATAFCDSVLKDVVMLNIEERLTKNDIFTEVRKYGGEIFRDTKALHAALTDDVLKVNNFDKKRQYFQSYETVLKEKLVARSIECLRENNRLHNLALEKLSTILDEVREAVKTTAEGPCVDADFISTFFSELVDLRLPCITTSADLLEVTCKRQFGAIVNDKLFGSIQDKIQEEITKWKVEDKLEEIKWGEFVYEEVRGCGKICPFCEAPCDAHTGGRKSGKHSATLHRPHGLREQGEYYGWKNWLIFLKLLSRESIDCQAAVASDSYRFLDPKSEKAIPYAQYEKVYPNWTIKPNPNPNPGWTIKPNPNPNPKSKSKNDDSWCNIS